MGRRQEYPGFETVAVGVELVFLDHEGNLGTILYTDSCALLENHSEHVAGPESGRS